MSRICSIGFKRRIPLLTALVFFAVAAGYVYENRLAQNRIFSLSLDQENLDMPLIHHLNFNKNDKIFFDNFSGNQPFSKRL